VRNFWTILGNINFPRRTLLHGVGSEFARISKSTVVKRTYKNVTHTVFTGGGKILSKFNDKSFPLHLYPAFILYLFSIHFVPLSSFKKKPLN